MPFFHLRKGSRTYFGWKMDLGLSFHKCDKSCLWEIFSVEAVKWRGSLRRKPSHFAFGVPCHSDDEIRVRKTRLIKTFRLTQSDSDRTVPLVTCFVSHQVACTSPFFIKNIMTSFLNNLNYNSVAKLNWISVLGWFVIKIFKYHVIRWCSAFAAVLSVTIGYNWWLEGGDIRTSPINRTRNMSGVQRNT